MEYAFLESWSEFLPLEGGHVVAFTGSVDKMLMLQTVVEFYNNKGLSTILCGTVAVQASAEVNSVAWLRGQDAPALPDESVVRVHGGVTPSGAWAGLEPAMVDCLQELNPQRVILCELDESSDFPVRLYEPTGLPWPDSTSLVLMMVGCQAAGSPVNEVLERSGGGENTPAALASMADHELFLWEHFDRLLLDEGGYLDQVPMPVPVVLLLTGLEEAVDSIGLFGCVDRLMQKDRFPLVMFCSRQDDVLQLKTACRIDAEGPDHE